jgi:ubiquinone/menaquinone biosynthesis C-methylase UbiE
MFVTNKINMVFIALLHLHIMSGYLLCVTDSAEGSYCLKNDEQALRRLHLLAQEDNPESQRLFYMLDIPNDATILSVGCGIGIFEQWLARVIAPKGAVYAADNDSVKVQYMHDTLDENKIHNFIPVLDDAYTLTSCGHRQYDIIYARYLFQHLSDPDKALTRMMALLKPGGYLIIDDEIFSASRTEPAHWAIEEVSHNITKKAEACLHTNYDIGASLEQLVQRHHFEIKIMRSFEQRSGSVGIELFINSIEEARDFLVGRMIITAEEIDAIIEGLQEVRHNSEQYTMVVQRNQVCAVKR